MTTWVIRHQKG